MGKTIVVLGTGTEIGKTYVAAALLEAARAQGRAVGAAKPLMSGFSPDRMEESDAGLLAGAAGAAAEKICLYSFEAPLAPNVAARRACVALDYQRIIAFSREAVAGADFALVEGAGGVLSPLTDEKVNADLARDLGFPVILVTADYLGAISHTLTALEACAARGLRVLALAIAQPTPEHGAPSALAEELARWTPFPAFCFGQEAPAETRRAAAGLLALIENERYEQAAGRQ
ncbi:MAG: dethiobiotin synthase [Parvularculaceae bacterium]|uniref:dethiobiotin synthase n=1 Tax=Methylocystis sp. TaxID=1911079 RepID=UPI003D1122C4